MNKLLRTCRSLRPRRPRAASLQRLPLFRLPRPIQRVGGHNFKTFRGGAHSSHRFGLSARSAPALTRQLPFASGRVLHLGLLDFKAVIFASHKLNSRLLAHDSLFKRAVRSMLRCRPRRTMSHNQGHTHERPDASNQRLDRIYRYSSLRTPRSAPIAPIDRYASACSALFS
jgi:hypothetical protein